MRPQTAPEPLPALPAGAPAAAFVHRPTASREDQAAAVAEITGRWAAHPVATGPAALHCFAATDGSALLTAGHWTSPRSRDEDLPHVLGPRADGGPDPRHERYRSLVEPPAGRVATCLVTAVFAVQDAPQQRAFVDRLAAVAQELPESAKHPGALSAHFSLGVDGRSVLNHTEWTDAAAHVEATEAGAHDRYYELFTSTPGLRSLGGRRYLLAASSRT